MLPPKHLHIPLHNIHHICHHNLLLLQTFSAQPYTPSIYHITTTPLQHTFVLPLSHPTSMARSDIWQPHGPGLWRPPHTHVFRDSVRFKWWRQRNLRALHSLVQYVLTPVLSSQWSAEQVQSIIYRYLQSSVMSIFSETNQKSHTVFLSLLQVALQ